MKRHWLCKLIGHKFRYIKPLVYCERCGLFFHNPYPPQGVGVGVTAHTALTDKEVAGVIDHADGSVPDAKLSGVLGVARIPNLDAAKITTGTFGTARIPSLDAAKITSGTFGLGRIPTPLTGKECTLIAAGVEASRPAGSATENIYFATDTKKLWAYDGSEWQDCKPPFGETGQRIGLQSALFDPDEYPMLLDLEEYASGFDWSAKDVILEFPSAPILTGTVTEVFLKAMLKSAGGGHTSSAKLYDVTNSADIPDTTFGTGAASYIFMDSGWQTLPSGCKKIQLYHKGSGATGYIKNILIAVSYKLT